MFPPTAAGGPSCPEIALLSLLPGVDGVKGVTSPVLGLADGAPVSQSVPIFKEFSTRLLTCARGKVVLSVSNSVRRWKPTWSCWTWVRAHDGIDSVQQAC